MLAGLLRQRKMRMSLCVWTLNKICTLVINTVLCYALLLSHVQLSVTPWTAAGQAPLSMRVLQVRILEWVAMPSSRGIFPTQRLNPGLLHCRQILYHLSYQGSPVKEYTTVKVYLEGIIDGKTWIIKLIHPKDDRKGEEKEHRTTDKIKNCLI